MNEGKRKEGGRALGIEVTRPSRRIINGLATRMGSKSDAGERLLRSPAAEEQDEREWKWLEARVTAGQ